MSETPIATATADVMLYDESIKKWVRPECIDYNGAINPGLSHVQVLQDPAKLTFRIVAIRIQDRQCLLNQQIFHKLKYQAATASFHQWRNEHRQVYGLNFSSDQDAVKFHASVMQAMEIVSNGSDYGTYGTYNGNGDASNGVYQDPHSYYQQGNFREPDQDSIGSNGTPQAYRQSNYSMHNHAQAPGLVSNGPQRRSSQGSSGSSSISSGPPNNIYATANHNNHVNGHHSTQSPVRAAPPNPPPQATQPSTATPAAVVRPPTNVPPPPPPPPPSALKSGGGQTMADMLKQTTLRKVSTTDGKLNANGQAPNRISSNSNNDTASIGSGSGSKTNTVSSTTPGHSELLSELAATFNRRNKTNTNNPSNDTANTSTASSSSAVSSEPNSSTVVEKKQNGTSELPNPRPWQKNGPLSNVTVTNNASTDSPKAHRKIPSGVSLSSQDESPKNPSAPITFTDLDRFKQEMMTYIQSEVSKAKQDIIEAIRQELRR